MDSGFVWDEEKYELVKSKHDVCFWEVVSAFDDLRFCEQPHDEYEDRMIAVAKTVNDRVLLVIYSDEDLPLFRLITAYDAPAYWLEVYNEQRDS